MTLTTNFQGYSFWKSQIQTNLKVRADEFQAPKKLWYEISTWEIRILM